MSNLITVWSDETDPDSRLAWYDAAGALRNFSGWTLSAKVVDPRTNTTVLDKVTGVVGGDGTGTVNVIISWTDVELSGLSNLYRLRVKAVQGTEVAVFTVDDQGQLPLLWVRPKPT